MWAIVTLILVLLGWCLGKGQVLYEAQWQGKLLNILHKFNISPQLWAEGSLSTVKLQLSLNLTRTPPEVRLFKGCGQ